MLVIRTRQYRAFEADVERRFAIELAEDLLKNNAEDVRDLDFDVLLDRVAAGMNRARRYGFKRKYSIGLFVELMFLAAPNFDEYPPAKSILTRGDIEIEHKMDVLIAAMDERHWRNVRRRADESAWKEDVRV